MQRREFVQAGLALSAVSNLAANTPGSLLKPKRLRPGMTVGVVAPASPAVEDETVRCGLDLVESFGFKVKPGKHIFQRNQYLAGSDAQRAEDLNAMFADDSVDAVMALAGGYGAMRILPALNYEVIRSNPKVFIGYSDITAIHCAVSKRSGLITYHGPTALSTFSDYSTLEFQRILMRPEARMVIGALPPFKQGPGKVNRENRITTIIPGKAQGRLIGGNLTLISCLMGTPYEPDFTNRIVFLEDVHETPYRIDRMLTQLLLSGKLKESAAIIFGKFTDAEARGNTFSLEHVLTDAAKAAGVPAARGVMIGHVEDQTVVPIGIEAEFDATSGRLTLLESPVA